MMAHAASQQAFILRAVAGEAERFWTAPGDLHLATDEFAGDALAVLALRAAATLLEDLPDTVRQRLGLFLGTATGSARTDHEFDRSRRDAAGRFASPAAFSRTLPSTLPAEISVKCRLRGPLVTLCAGHDAACLALQRALRWMDHFSFDLALAGGFEWPAARLGAGTPPPRLAFLLLSRHRENARGALRIGPPRFSSQPSAPALGALLNWVVNPARLALSPQVELLPGTQ